MLWTLTPTEQAAMEQTRELARAVNAAQAEVLDAALVWWRARVRNEEADDRLCAAVFVLEEAKAALLVHVRTRGEP